MQKAILSIVASLIFCQCCILLVSSNDIHHEDPVHISRKPPINQGVYIRKVFRYIPEKDNWQQKFAETISKAIEEEKGEDFSHPNHEEPLHKETHGAADEYEKQHPRNFISPDLDPHVIGSQADVGYVNETTAQKNDSFGIKTNVVHIPAHPDQQYANNEKGEILIHRPAPIIVNRPPTKVLVNHPPLIVKPAPVIFHRPPSVIVRQVFVKPKQSEPVKMQPVYVKVIKPAPEKIYIKEQVACDDHQYDSEYNLKQRYYPSQYNF